ncbi:PilZ domain-containing protein [Methylobacterium sp. NEAU K]|uniref:PilZ domain-containing protein n=1 Tax=Methylobacterium sp. NEAU K TaxID=3064946 RepID=UPI002732B00E|nr:PilZ domain-containing protein [Methylobacterium sp. NEAU K]MDP4005124.1 PilZ domain-containing protein [Methylobacterium sp. NEAU K]
MAEERRNEPRSHALKTGQLAFGHPQEHCDCLVWDIARSGAMIELEPDMTAPETFRLISTGLSLNQLCEVVWRDGQKLGLKFVI